ncbi:MAG: prephenate dehydrogenase/arogenate dehydrogenase family protein [Cytophagales bacterium]|nr:prephenate dehydrogenase/arogenate dehydrogenase family protein [Armatimonadota bacterium]
MKRLVIIGVGLIGGSLGMAARGRRLAQTVVGIGRSADTLRQALQLGAIDEAASDFATGIQAADVVVLATPIPQILDDLARLPALLAPGAVVTDVGSTKGEIARAGDRLFPGGVFVPGHPMAGSERSGVEAARADLFIEATWALTPTPQTDPEALNRIRDLARGVGARTVLLDPDAHDRGVAVTSHLPHVLAYALAALAGKESQTSPALLDLAAGSFASATRVAGSSPELWRDIALSNRTALLRAVRAYRATLGEVEAALERGDGDALLDLFQEGNLARKGA